jgi:hypothetical protein
MPGFYIVILCTIALLIALELGRRALVRYDKLHWLEGTWFWFLLAWVSAGLASLVCAGVIDAVIWTIITAFGQLLAMGIASFIVTRFRFRGRPAFRSWLLAAICLGTSLNTVWYSSRFFGIPREVMSLAFQARAPLVFTVVDYKSEAWTDFLARMTVEFPPGALQPILANMGEPHIAGDALVFSWVKEAGTPNAHGASIRMRKDMSRAEITYWTE